MVYMFERVKKFFSSKPKGYKEIQPGVLVEKRLTAQEAHGHNEQPTFNSPFVYKQEQPNYKSKFDWLYDPTHGVRWDFNPMMTRNLAQSDTWVQMLITNISKEIANTPWEIVENDGVAVQKDHPFERVAKNNQSKEADSEEAEEARELLISPNPNEDFTDLLIQMIADLLEVGSVAVPKMFAKSDYNGQELATNDPTLIHIKTSDPVTFTKNYEERTGIQKGFFQYDRNVRSNTRGSRSGPIEFDNIEIIWADLNPRSNRRYGLPPTLIVKDWLELMDLTTEQEKRYWSRGAFPAGFITSDGDINEIEMLKDETAEARGKPEKQIFHVGDSDATFEKMGLTWKELEMTKREEWYAKIIASAFQVPTSVVGIKPEDVNRSTFRAERENFESNTLSPYMQKLERIINSQLIWQHFGKDIKFEFKPGMSETQRQKISERVTKEWDSNAIKRNEIRRQLGYPEVDDELNGFKDDVTEDTEQPPLQMSLGNVSKPFGPWQGHDECVEYMMDEEGYDEETAHKVCQSIEDDLKTKKQDEPLRNTDDFQTFEVQPSDVEEVKEEIQEDVKAVLEDITSNERFNEIVESMAQDEEQKNSAELRRLLSKMIKNAALSRGLEETILATTGEKVLESLGDVSEEIDEDINEDAIKQRIENRDMGFVDDYAKRMEEDIRDTVSEGWQENKTTDEIKEDLQDKAEEFSDYQAERIARDQLQRATGEARNEFAKQTDRVEVWLTSGDDRVRPAHEEMDGKWKYPEEDFLVDYGDDEAKESFPGDSQFGIQCRCDTLLKPKEDVEDKNHAGV